MFDRTQGNILDGLLAGDGHIPRNQDLLYFGQCRRNREYVEFVARQLDIPLERIQDRVRKPDARTGRSYECSELRTLSHPVFARYRERWYGEGKKAVPESLKASREFVLHWFLCDGACSVNRGGGHLMLCTDSFDRESVKRLQSLLESAGVESTQTDGGRIRVRQKSLVRFFDYVGDSPVSCLAHEWIPVENRAARQKDLKPFYAEIYRLFARDGWSCQRIADAIGSNYFSVRYVLKTKFGLSFGKNAVTETTCREGVVAPSETARRASPRGE